MSWHCLQEEGEEFSLQKYLDGIPSVQLKSSGSQGKCYFKDSRTGIFQNSLFGMTSGRLTVSHGDIKSTLSPEDFPVRISALQVKAQALPADVADFGRSIKESLGRYGLRLSMRKTLRDCVPVGSILSSKTLTAWGMMQDGVCWELGTSVRLIKETECGYWPTLMRRDHLSGKGPACAARKSPSLPTVLNGLLNPTWAEWLMGWPEGWTGLKPLGTVKFQEWLRQHGEY